ncbi:MAG: glutathione S-transferase family protein [Granulosicoccus sp.]
MITVWGRRSSSNVQAVLWCISELGLEYERIDAGLMYGVVDTDEYLSMNPNGTVPTIRDDNLPSLYESGAILRYLAGRYASEPFWPNAPAERAAVDQWAEWAKINIAQQFTAPIFWRVARTPVERQDPEAIADALARFERSLVIAEHQLTHHDYLAGEFFTLADIQFSHVLYRYYDLDINRAALNGIRQYYNRISTRPAYQQHVCVSYDELKNTK